MNFGLMHLVATNMCVWFRYLVIEVSESIHDADSHADIASSYDGGIVNRNVNEIRFDKVLS